jgi:hypothetical protein
MEFNKEKTVFDELKGQVESEIKPASTVVKEVKETEIDEIQ